MAITKKDVEKLSEVFATKEDLSKFEARIDQKFATKEEFKQVANDLSRFRNEVTISHDKIFKKLEDMTIEMKIGYSQYRRQEDQLENHEKRLVVLETVGV